MAEVIRIVVSVDGSKPKTFRGRQAWTLNELIRAGKKGVATVERPAPRWSDYVMHLRRSSVGISTDHEKHGGAYRGHHGRYRLTSKVRVIEKEVA